MKKQLIPHTLLALPLALSALTACGEEEKPAPAGPGNIVAVASADTRFSTLVAAVQAAGLVDTLSGPGPFTVFAPTNDAFAKLPAGTLDALLADKPALTDILTYHVLGAKQEAAAVTQSKWLSSVQGASMRIRTDADGAWVNGAKIVITDIPASNGVIHVIDAVITPPTIAGLAALEPELSTLVTALGAANLVDTMNGAGPFTVFAPTNAAFDALPAGALDALLADKTALAGVLTYHVVAEALPAAAVTAGSKATVAGAPLTITVEGGAPKINGAAVVTADIVGTNGVIHVIDAVLLPPS